MASVFPRLEVPVEAPASPLGRDCSHPLGSSEARLPLPGEWISLWRLASCEAALRPLSFDGGHLHIKSALTSDREELLSQLFPALRGLGPSELSCPHPDTEASTCEPFLPEPAAGP